MAAHYDPLPFDLGQTLKGTDADGNLINKEVLGKVFTCPAYSTVATGTRQPRPKRSEQGLTLVALRNVSGITLYGKRTAALKSAAGIDGVTSVDGYGGTLGQDGVVFIDEFLATSGVADKDIFWAVVRGPVIVRSSYVDTNFNGDIAYGSPIVQATAAATTAASTSGRVSNITLVANATQAAQAEQNRKMSANIIARALSSLTTANTDADLLVNANCRMLW